MADDFRISLAAARVNAGLTQKEVAETIGISNATLIKWESGETVPTTDKAELLAKLYQCPLNRINFCRKS